MLLTITSTHSPATDLGYLLHKNPARCQSFDLTFGRAHVFYPEATREKCTAALLLDIDPVSLVRGRAGSAESGPLAQYVNDRPYVASSFLSVAIAEVFGTALRGQCKDKPELVTTPLPLSVEIAVLPCRGGEGLARRLFEPLGYTVTVERHGLDSQYPEWGASPYYSVNLEGNVTLSNLLSHLYVLIPVTDDDKHYWVGDDEIEKLLRVGGSWLSGHPERELIAHRYLKHRRSLVRQALERLTDKEDLAQEQDERVREVLEESLEEKISLNSARLASVVTELKELGVRRVLDLGCGEGNLLKLLLHEKSFEEILGMDVSCRCLEIAQARLHMDTMAPKKRERIQLIQGSLLYRDKRLEGYDAAVVAEVIEHLDADRLSSFERVLFEYARPGAVVLTTPNREYNVTWENLPAGKMRHRDHRFEWTRAEFREWADGIAKRFGYQVKYSSIGPDDPVLGSPTQMAVFTR